MNLPYPVGYALSLSIIRGRGDVVTRFILLLSVGTGPPITDDELHRIRSHRVRQARAGPLLDQLRSWFDTILPKLSGKSELAGAIRYARTRWRALLRYRDDGRLEIDNNAAERALRRVALGRKNWLFAGSDKGGERAAAIYSLIETAKLNGVDPEAYLRDILARIADHSISRVDELLPWYWAKQPANLAV